MPSSRKSVPLHGSERTHPHGATVVGEAPPHERVHVTLLLRRHPSKKEFSDKEWHSTHPLKRKYLTREEFEARYGADPQDLAKVEDFAREHGLTIMEADKARRTVVLIGTSAKISAAFGVERFRYEHAEGSHCGHTGPTHIPAELEGIVRGVIGLDDRRQAKRSPLRQPLEAGVTPPITIPKLAELYNFPQGLDGHGQCVAIIALGGGYRHEDLVSYFKQLNLPLPKVSAVSVHGIFNDPDGRTGSNDYEVAGDIEVAGAIAPGARYVVYFASNTDQGFFHAVTKAIHDKHYRPHILSISYGDSESSWTPLVRKLFNESLEEAARMGVTVLCAAGDWGSKNDVPGDTQHVMFPASSPYVMACGGTSITLEDGRIVKETVWNGPHGVSGGGISEDFELPDWQKPVHVPVSANPAHRKGRGLPDVAGAAEGYSILVNGKPHPGAGTSAVAPLWAGLIARINQKLGHSVGYLNPLLYQEYGRLCSLGAFREITEGDIGAYKAGKGWNACTGLGSPDGHKLVSALTLRKVAKA